MYIPSIPPRLLWCIATFSLTASSCIAFQSSQSQKRHFQAVKAVAPRINIWQGLTESEMGTVMSWLFSQEDLNLTKSNVASDWDNTVLLIELQLPNKTDALSYIDGTKPAPARFARCVLDVRTTMDPTYSDILVGPLPVQDNTKWWPLEFTRTRDDGGKTRNTNAVPERLDSWIANHTMSISDITEDLWQGHWNGSQEGPLNFFGLDPLWQDEIDGVSRVEFWGAFWRRPRDPAYPMTLLPLGLFLNADVTGRDPSQWRLKGWLYNDILYPTTQVFKEAYSSSSFERLGDNVEGTWTKTDRHGPILPMDSASPPVTTVPEARFAIDLKANYITWMGWSFYLVFEFHRGLSFFDIRYEGERIVYELGLQEGLAHYAGHDPMPGGAAFLDSLYGFGASASQLLQGYDCPSHATYLNTSTYSEETVHTRLKSICLFEAVASYPLQRHSTIDYVSATENVYFTVRSVATLGNYDYIFSYEFYIDGSFKVNVHASGYILASFKTKSKDYGYIIHENLAGGMHDHVLNFKADFDILGRENTVEVMDIVPSTESYVWSTKPRKTMKAKRRFLESEDESKLFYGLNGATSYSIVNCGKLNEHNEPRGYRISPQGAVHLAVEESSALRNAVNWAKYDLAVTVQKDSEPQSVHPYNGQDVFNPPVDFDKFFDGEQLYQSDLVVWFNLGMHHVPHTGDLPNTVTITAHSGIHFVPLNYFDKDTSRRTVSQIRLAFDESGVRSSDTFGQDKLECSSLVQEPSRSYEYNSGILTPLGHFEWRNGTAG